ncbi:phage tail protein [Enterobacter mori]|uniref:pyocin knob domain-containing protein n=1 Tax=Enterobacter mori TaxID=539813 RepID=UPI001BE01F9D|nr:pyocin knob domain-containing protein [Enterobacter mori]MBT2102154.1 phage tail protein [Enterobacter mori]
MLYNTGTIAINGNTATGTGTNWTAPASQVRAGQTIIVMSNPVQMFQISSVNSATSMTVTPAASPALSGQKYGILVSDNISVDGLAQAMSQLIKEYDENIGAWEAFATTSANQTITVTINGASVSIPGIGKLLQKGANGALAVKYGGTGATKAEDARTNLGLGTSATLNSGTSEGNVLLAGSSMGSPTDGYRFFQTLDPMAGVINVNDAIKAGLFPNLINGSEAVNAPANGYYYLLNFVRGGTGAMQQFALPYATSATSPGRMFFRGKNGSTVSAWAEIYTTVNTTKASDGTLKAASPVARIVKSQEESQRNDVADDGFTWCGCGTANAEAEGIKLSRLDVGVYVLTGSAGLASEGWQLLPPMDPGGMGELGVVEAEQTESGGLTIRLFKRKYMLGDDGEIIKAKGEMMDVPANSWIDVRLDMPETSIWNQGQKEANEAAR